MTDAPLIRARGLCKHYGGQKPVEVLRDLDLDVAAGEAVVIVGQSGVGKSTLLNLLGALDTPSSGEVDFAGVNLGAVQRNFNVPTMALFFLHPNNVARFKFRKDGEDTLDGHRVWKVRYEETRKPTIIRTSAGKDMPLKGTFWIDASGGPVLKTHMEMSSEATLTGQERGNHGLYGAAELQPGKDAATATAELRDLSLKIYARAAQHAVHFLGGPHFAESHLRQFLTHGSHHFFGIHSASQWIWIYVANCPKH